MIYSLRPYQTLIEQNIRDAYRHGYRAPLLVSPCGSGKTVTFSSIAEQAGNRGKRILILAHRKELITQDSEKLDAFGVQHGIIAPGYPLTADHVQVASVQTVVRRLDRIAAPDLIIADEAQHSAATGWARILSAFPRARLLGVTATPVRLDGKGLGVNAGGFFDKLIYGPTVKELTALGFLSPAVVYAPPMSAGVTLDDLHHKFGEYQMAEASERLDKPVIYGDAVKHYQRICPGVPAIAFCPSVHNAEVLADYFENSGIPAASIDGKMSDAQRKHRIEGLGNGRYLVLTNCALVEEGTDIPIVGAAILQRPTESMGLAIQQMGRCLRPYPGKTQSYILDMVGNCGGVINGAFVAKHGLPDDDREWSLDGAVVKPKGEASEPTLVRCMKCFHLFPRYMKACDLCGTPKEVSEHEIQQVEGDLQVITPESIRLDYLRREEAKRNAKELIRRARTLPELQECARILGYKSSWAYFIFKSRMGKVAV